MEHTEKRTSGKKCAACHNNIAVNSNTWSANDKHFHLHCVPPRKRR